MLREVQDLAEKFKEEDEQYISPYAQLEKAAVLQEARYVSNSIETQGNGRASEGNLLLATTIHM